jgi:hypothetical protein
MDTMKEAQEIWLFALDMAGGVWDLDAFGTSGQGRKLHLQPLGDTEECPARTPFLAWRQTFLSTCCFQTSS